MDSRMYPQGAGGLHGNYVNGVLTFTGLNGTVYTVNPLSKAVAFSGAVTFNGVTINGVKTSWVQHTTAELNAGQVLLAAVPGFKYRIIDWTVIAVGGAMGTASSLEIEGNQSGVVDLASIAAGELTQSAVNDKGGTVTVLADGASFVANDVNTAIGLSCTGTADTMTHVDVGLIYALEA